MFTWLLSFEEGMLMPIASVSYIISLILIIHFARKKSTNSGLWIGVIRVLQKSIVHDEGGAPLSLDSFLTMLLTLAF